MTNCDDGAILKRRPPQGPLRARALGRPARLFVPPSARARRPSPPRRRPPGPAGQRDPAPAPRLSLGRPPRPRRGPAAQPRQERDGGVARAYIRGQAPSFL